MGAGDENQPVYHKKTFENIPEEKRRRILAVAIGEFANKGFDNANINVRQASASGRFINISIQSRICF